MEQTLVIIRRLGEGEGSLPIRETTKMTKPLETSLCPKHWNWKLEKIFTFEGNIY